MDSSSETDMCVLLVAMEATLSTTLKLLNDANYRVVIAYKGEDALSILQNKTRKVDLVLTETKLPDVCGFMFAQILETEYRMPVVMLSETNHQLTLLRSLLNRAMDCLFKPLNLDDVKDLWKCPLLKERETMEESLISGNTDEIFGMHEADEDTESSASSDADEGSEMHEADEIKDKLEPSEFPVAGNNSQSPKRNTEDEGTSTRLPTPFMWTPYIHAKFLNILWELGVYDVTPAKLLQHINAPGLTMQIITEKLEKYHLYLKREEDLAHNNPFRMMDEVINRMCNTPQPDEEIKESTYFRLLKQSGKYADPFPWAMEMLNSAEALLGGSAHFSFALQAPHWMPSINAVHRKVPPSWYNTLP